MVPMGSRILFDRIPLHAFAERVSREINIELAKEYRTIGCRLYGQGVYRREVKTGAEIKAERMFLVKENDLVIDRIWAQKGSVGIVKHDTDGSVVTQDFPVYTLDVTKVQPSYIAWYVRTRDFWEECKKHSHGTSGRQRLSPNEISNVTFPICGLKEQQLIVSRIDEIMHKIDVIRKLRKAATMETRTESDPAQGLKLRILSGTDVLMRAIRGRVFDAAKPIGSVVPIGKSELLLNKETINPQTAGPDVDFQYLDISGVESGTGRILQIRKYKGRDTPSRARRLMKTGDVLMSTVRPYLRSFTIVPSNLNDQVCSTGFAVFTCPSNVEPEFLLNQLFSDFFVEQCTEKMRGAHYPAINVSKLSECRLMFPSSQTQRSIVRWLNSLHAKVCELKRLQAETEKEIEVFASNILDKAFKGEL
jgi:type I restriction enzyme S subunit